MLETKKKQSHGRHWMVVAAGIAAGCMTALAFNSAGIFMPSVMRALGLATVTQLSFYLTIAAFVMAVSMPLWGSLVEKFSIKLLGSAAVIVVACTFFMMSFAVSVVVFYIAGVLFGLTMAFLTYMFIPTMINRWFAKRVGTFTGLCYAAASFGAVIFNPIGGAVIDSLGWAAGYRVFGVIALVLCLPFMLLMKDRPSDCGLLPYGVEDDSGRGSKNTALVQEEGVTSKVAMKSSAFYLAAISAACLGIIAGIYQLLPTYASKLPIAEGAVMLGSTLASAAMIGSTIGKLALGYLNDISVKLALSICAVAGSVGMLLMWLLPVASATVLVGGFLYGVLFAGTTVQTPLLVRKAFGLRDYNRIYSRVSMVRSLFGAFGVTIWSISISSGGYALMFSGGIVVAVILAVCGITAVRMGQRLIKANRVPETRAAEV